MITCRQFTISLHLEQAFTSDPSVLAIIASLIPFIVLTQPINALAFVWDGLHYGASDFVYSAQVMVRTLAR